jgi:mannose-1-phosphate guanylyltransferase
LIHAIILAGGRGTRFLPLSRETRPKQMLHIVGEDTLLRQTIKRLDGFHPSVNIWIVTVKSLAEDIRFHLQPLEKDAERVHFIIEPFGKNTALAIVLAALILNKISPNSIMVVIPSDHSIKSIKQFQEKLQGAIQLAEQGYLATFGIKPSRPETAYGYIQSGPLFKNSNNEIFHVEKNLI